VLLSFQERRRIAQDAKYCFDDLCNSCDVIAQQVLLQQAACVSITCSPHYDIQFDDISRSCYVSSLRKYNCNLLNVDVTTPTDVIKLNVVSAGCKVYQISTKPIVELILLSAAGTVCILTHNT
jgi:hypothetical protein